MALRHAPPCPRASSWRMGSQDEYPDDGEYPPIKGAIVRGVWVRRSGCFLNVSMTGCFHSSRLHRCPLLAEVTSA